MDKIDNDVDLHAALLCFGLDEIDLMAGPVDQDNPRTVVAGVAVLCLVEHGGHHLRAVSVTELHSHFDRALSPWRRSGAASWTASSCWSGLALTQHLSPPGLQHLHQRRHTPPTLAQHPHPSRRTRPGRR
ncbi:hypothetical protein [Streptomyces sp. NPDC086182]|uniref:hypothetical protein n=1 Tax=Streptomyces sp. NPDC086182 TaxID=3155058 RepID=UPI00343A023A